MAESDRGMGWRRLLRDAWSHPVFRRGRVIAYWGLIALLGFFVYRRFAPAADLQDLGAAPPLEMASFVVDILPGGASMERRGQVTVWLQRLSDGDDRALERLIPLLYDELRILARSQLRRERTGHTLATTDLVNKAFLRLVDQQQLGADDRPKFFAIAATTMRRVLVDYARSRKRLKRGGGLPSVSLHEARQIISDEEADEVIALDEALHRLTTLEPRVVRVVECRYYSGLTIDQPARALGISSKSVQRDSTTARAWLRKEMRGGV